MSRIPDSVSFAAQVGARINSLLGARGAAGGKEESFKMGLIRRAREFPGLALSLGLPSALTFYMSKAGEKLRDLDKLVKCLRAEGSDGECEDMWRGELSREEGSGYLGYIAILVLALGKLGQEPKPLDYGGLMSVLRELDVRKQRLLMPYLIEVKKVLEALG
ncbi:MAG: hypothetical protein ACP5ID_06770 [Conexivisphaera sp.]